MAIKFLRKIIEFLNVGLDEYLIQSLLLVIMRNESSFFFSCSP